MNLKNSLNFRLKKIRNSLNQFPVYCREQVKYALLNQDHILIAGGGWTENFGDALNTILVEELSDKKVIHADFLKNTVRQKPYVVIGSILQWVKKPSIIWGAGFISKNSTVSTRELEIIAVRGPLTVKSLEEQNFNCKDVALGDPALLLPLIYNPSKIKKKYKVGLVPHYVDKDNPWIDNIFKNKADVVVIDIMCGQDWKKFVDQLLSCDIIFSSSLHGLIVAEAYNIPTVWVSFSEKVLGGGFKFRDYYESIGVMNSVNHKISSETLVEDMIAKASLKDMEINLPKLINSCPFITEDNRKMIFFRLSEISNNKK